jgi:hypothetical protein
VASAAREPVSVRLAIPISWMTPSRTLSTPLAARVVTTYEVVGTDNERGPDLERIGLAGLVRVGASG